MRALRQKLVLIITFIAISIPMVSAQQTQQSFIDLVSKIPPYGMSYVLPDFYRDKLNIEYTDETISFEKVLTPSNLDKAFESRLSNLVGTWYSTQGRIITITPNGTGNIIGGFSNLSVPEVPELSLYNKLSVSKYSVKDGIFSYTVPVSPYKWMITPRDKGEYNKLSLRLKNEVDKAIAKWDSRDNQYNKTKTDVSFDYELKYVSKDVILLIVRSWFNDYKGAWDIWIRESAARPLIEKAIEQGKIRAEEAAKEAAKEAEIAKKYENVYSTVAEQAEFPGGNTVLKKYISDHIKYPEGETEEGRVWVEFIIREDGSITDIKVFQGLTPDLDAEAIRVVKSMPRWKPGKVSGKAVASIFRMPVSFKMPLD